MTNNSTSLQAVPCQISTQQEDQVLPQPDEMSLVVLQQRGLSVRRFAAFPRPPQARTTQGYTMKRRQLVALLDEALDLLDDPMDLDVALNQGPFVPRGNTGPSEPPSN